jgi:hypothetical protein
MPIRKMKNSATGLAITRLAASGALLLLAACAATPPPRLNEVGGRAVVLGPDPGFSPASLRDPWWTAPPRESNRFATVDLEGTLVLRIDAPAPDQPSTIVIGRRLAVPLLAMPYLQWAWYLEPAAYEGGPGDGLDRGVKLSVGFYGGAPSTSQLTAHLFGGPAGFPLHDRRFDIVFSGIGAPRSDDAAQRVTVVSDRGIVHELQAPQFKQSGAWKLEAIDIAKLYEQFWPQDRINLAQIAFIGAGGLGRPVVKAQSGPLPIGYVAEVTLTR